MIVGTSNLSSVLDMEFKSILDFDDEMKAYQKLYGDLIYCVPHYWKRKSK